MLGGAISADQSRIFINKEGVIITNNTATSGGGIYLRESTHNRGLETLKITVWRNDSEMLVYQLLPSLHHHPELKTLILNSYKVTDIKPVSKLMLYNSTISTVDIKKFTLDELKEMVPCLVFNGRRTEFDCCSRTVNQDMETFQREVDTFVFIQCLK